MPAPRLLQRFTGQNKEGRQVKEQRRLKSFFSTDWTDEKDIVSFVGGMWDTRRQRRSWIERQWYINIAFYLGHQWLEWDESRGQLYRPSAPPWRVRLTANLVQGITRKIVSTIMRQKPIWSVMPATGDQDDIVAARVNEKTLKYYWGILACDPKFNDALNWMSTTGLGIWRLHWDPNKASEMVLDESDVEDVNLKGRLKDLQKTGKNRINLGEADVEVKSPFEIDPDPWARSFEEVQWVMETTRRPIQWLKDRYPKTSDDLQPEDVDELNFFERRIADLAGPNSATFSGGRHSLAGVRGQQDMINVHEVWGLPFGKFPRGIYTVVAGDSVHDVRANQFRGNGEVALPYMWYEEIKVPGRLWPTCALEQAISLQAEYNRGRSQVIENRNQMGRPKWLVPKGANLGDYALTSEPGEVVEHTFGHAPIAWTPPPLPPYVLRTLELARLDIQDVAQIHDVTQGKQPGSVRSGTAINALQEQDLSVLAPTMQGIEFQLKKFGSMLLELLSRKVKEPRLLKITGKNELYDVFQFTGSDLTGKNKDKTGVNYFDVRVNLGTQLPLTPDGRRQFISELAQAGILDTQADKRRILELLELGSEEPLYDEARLDIANQRQENRIMLDKEIPMEVRTYDDDLIHLEVIDNFQKTPDYASRRTDISDAIFEDHRQLHIAQIQAKQAGQAPEPGGALAQQAGGGVALDDAFARSTAQQRVGEQIQSAGASIAEGA